MCWEGTTYEESFFFILLGFASLHKWCSCDSYTPNNESFHEEVKLILLWTHFWQCLGKKEQVNKEKMFQQQIRTPGISIVCSNRSFSKEASLQDNHLALLN